MDSTKLLADDDTVVVAAEDDATVSLIIDVSRVQQIGRSFAVMDSNSLSVDFDGQVPRVKTIDLPSHALRVDWDSAERVTKTSARIFVRQGRVRIGEHMAKECNVSYDRVFASVTVIFVVSLGAKQAQAEGSVRLHVDLTLLLSCTFLSLVTELLCALDHSSNALALAQGCHKTELHLSVSVCVRCVVLFSCFLGTVALSRGVGLGETSEQSST